MSKYARAARGVTGAVALLSAMAAGSTASAESWYRPQAAEQRPAPVMSTKKPSVLSAQASFVGYESDLADAVAERSARLRADSSVGAASAGVFLGVVALGDETGAGPTLLEGGVELNPLGGFTVSNSGFGRISILTPSLSGRLVTTPDESTTGYGFSIGVTGVRYCRCGVTEGKALVIDVRAPVYSGLNLSSSMEDDGNPYTDESMSDVSLTGWGASVGIGMGW